MHALRSAIERARALGSGVVSDYQIAKDEILRRMEQDPALHASIAEHLRRDFADNLSQSHDFLQLVKLVRGHAESLLHDRYPNLPPSEAADQLPTEGAIYYSTSLMIAKMDSMVFLNEINQAQGGEKRFQIHPAIIKYLRIYNWQAEQKDLKIRVDGSCYGASFYNPSAIGAVVQSLLDNLVKYAPANSTANIEFQEAEGEVTISFTSLGPQITEAEHHQIFLPKYRATAAKAVELTGLGVGLAIAKEISDSLGLGLSVEQDLTADLRFPGKYRTSFAITLGLVI